MEEISRTTAPFDALLLVSFGGPEQMSDVMPFLENVLRGRNVPHERMLEVAHHYEIFDGVSPINEQNRQLIAALKQKFAIENFTLPIYWGNRNWDPYLADTMQQMATDGITNAVAFFTSAYSSYSGCRQYREDLKRAQDVVGENAPQVSLLRKFFNHPGFIGANSDNVAAALAQIAPERQPSARLIFTAHSIPQGMARNSNYEKQLQEACSLVAEAVGLTNWRLVYQSRSGPPSQPWLEPDIGDYLRELAAEGVTDVIVAPVGFISDHLEVLFDLDYEAQAICKEIDISMVRAATAGISPAFVDAVYDLITERIKGRTDKAFLGTYGPSHDVCPIDCCLPGSGKALAAAAGMPADRDRDSTNI